eukprot:TRINITY_DN3058_c0_g1_i1.p1 TRINITY_DN3058_c0_g1~~TRINITY_DN3058_c0_g1_i1.p1  ORF type:complete len:285 (-),score=88.45 TRINITY_DN3058_c0_g1_i1:33-887(-)
MESSERKEEEATSESAKKLQEYEATVAQQNAIQEEIKKAQLLVGKAVSPSALSPEYADNVKPGFLKGIEYLSKRYARLRPVRGDGNCFYRALTFALLENLVLKLQSGDAAAAQAAKAEAQRLVDKVKESCQTLLSLGYEEVSFDMFSAELLEALEGIESTTPESLEAKFNEDGGSGEYIMWFCRLLTSAFIKSHPSRFESFLIGDTVDTFCTREVEPLGVECEQLQIIALCEQLDIGVRIEYLNGEDFDASKGLDAVPVNMDGGREAAAELLFRPGHYDILYTA